MKMEVEIHQRYILYGCCNQNCPQFGSHGIKRFVNSYYLIDRGTITKSRMPNSIHVNTEYWWDEETLKVSIQLSNFACKPYINKVTHSFLIKKVEQELELYKTFNDYNIFFHEEWKWTILACNYVSWQKLLHR